MRRFTFIASSMRKVLTHLVLPRRRVFAAITGWRRAEGSSGEREVGRGGEWKAIYALKIRTTLLLSNHCEWSSSSNWCLRKIISAASSAKKGLMFDGAGVRFIQHRRRRKKKTIAQVIQRWQEAWCPPGREGGGSGVEAAPPHILPCSEPPPLLSPLSSCSCKRPQVDLPAYVSGL